MRGLDNIGNTCYMNSSLQALYAIKPFRKYILNSNSQKTLHVATKKLFHQMSDQTKNEISIEPNEFWTVFTKLNKEFEDKRQHDSQEFLNFLIIGIHEEVNQAKARQKNRPNDEPKDSETAWKRFIAYEDDSELVGIFAGQLRSTTRCTECAYHKFSWEAFWQLSAPLPEKSEECTVDDCVKLFLADEELDSDSMIKCPNCNEKRKVCRKSDLERLPKVLIIHLKRFDNEGKKKHTKVSINEKMAFGQFGYSLISWVSHHGFSCSGGHYISHCKRGQKWYRFDDETFWALDQLDLSADSEPYIVFYQRI